MFGTSILLFLCGIASTAAHRSVGRHSPRSSQSAQQQYLDDHNSFRAQHGAQLLTWSASLAATAQNWANGCKFQHSGSGNGENLAVGTGDFTIANAIKAWTDEASSYDPNNPQPSHFTQVVWKSTTQLGCAVAACNDIRPGFDGVSQYYVCEYSPPGNVIGEFPENVQP